MSRPGLGVPKVPPPPNDYTHQAPKTQPHPFETGQPQKPLEVVITDESDKGPDESKKPTSWVPDQKVAYGGIGGAVTTLLIIILKSYGVEIDPISAGAIATLVTFLVQYLIPGGGS